MQKPIWLGLGLLSIAAVLTLPGAAALTVNPNAPGNPRDDAWCPLFGSLGDIGVAACFSGNGLDSCYWIHVRIDDTYPLRSEYC